MNQELNPKEGKLRVASEDLVDNEFIELAEEFSEDKFKWFHADLF